MRLTTAAVCAAAGLVLAAAPARAAAPGSLVPAAVGYQALCSAAKAPGYAQCDVLRRIVPGVEPGARPAGAAPAGAAPAGLGPADLQDAYNLDAGAGTGEIVAVVGAYDDPAANSDLAVYRSRYGLPPCTEASGCLTVVSQAGSPVALPQANPGWAVNDTLQLDMISAICPLCRIDLVEANTAAVTDLGTAENEAVALGAHFISDGWGWAESPQESTWDADYFDHPSVAIAAAAGNAGYGVQYPAASRFVTAVGGTWLARSASAGGWTQSAWSGGGAGCSLYDAKPAWQTDSGCAHRTLADVAAVADPSTGVAVYTGGTWGVYGGTEVAAAIIAAVYALAGLPPSGSFPAQFPYQHSASLSDVTTGRDGTCSPAYLCTAGTGYDGPTGLGTPDGTAAFTGEQGTGPAAPGEEAFQSNTSELRTASPSGTTHTGLSMALLTSPAIARLPAGGYEAAFQARNGDLSVYGPGGVADTGYGMMAGTSPAIAAASGGGFDIAFQANTGVLWNYSSATGTAIPLGLGMQAASSPAITALPGGGYRIAFEANTGDLWTTSTAGGGTDLELGMRTGTSPAIAAASGGGFDIAFQANTGVLWTYSSATGAGAPLGPAMAPATSPAIAALAGGGYQIAYAGANGDAWTTPATGSGTDLGVGLYPATSPAITALPGGGYSIAVQGSTTTLWTIQSGTLITANLNDPLAPYSSPAIAP